MKKIIVLLIVIVNFSCTNKNRLLNTEKRITSFLDKQKENSFNLSLDTISSFKWDELLIAGPYTDLNKISGYDLSETPNTIKHHDSFVLFVFLNEKKGIKFIEIDRHLLADQVFEDDEYDYKIYSKSKSNLLIVK